MIPAEEAYIAYVPDVHKGYTSDYGLAERWAPSDFSYLFETLS